MPRPLLDFKPTPAFNDWWNQNFRRLLGHSLYSKASVIWNAARLQPPINLTIGVAAPAGATVVVMQHLPDGTHKVLAQTAWPAGSSDRSVNLKIEIPT